MAWAEFSADFDWKPAWHTTIAFKAGARLSVTRACLDAAIAAGKAIEIEAPGREPQEDPPHGERADGQGPALADPGAPPDDAD